MIFARVYAFHRSLMKRDSHFEFKLLSLNIHQQCNLQYNYGFHQHSSKRQCIRGFYTKTLMTGYVINFLHAQLRKEAFFSVSDTAGRAYTTQDHARRRSPCVQ